jgi:hypothetical protein
VKDTMIIDYFSHQVFIRCPSQYHTPNYLNGDKPCESIDIPVYNGESEAIEAGWKKINDTWVCPTCQKEKKGENNDHCSAINHSS